MGSRFVSRRLLATFLSLIAATAWAQQAAAPAAFRSDPAFVAEVAAARAQGETVAEQIQHWQQANVLAPNHCAE